MIKIENDTCICGHSNVFHTLGIITKRPRCGKCSEKDSHKFKVDNLKYLEQCYDKRKYL